MEQNPTFSMPGAWDGTPGLKPSLSPISHNKTLFIMRSPGAYNRKPDAVDQLESVEEVMAHFKPEVKATLTLLNEAGKTTTTVQRFQFRDMGDFTKKGLIDQSELMQKLEQKIADLKQINMQLNSNQVLQEALLNPDLKATILAVIDQLLTELTATPPSHD